MKVREGWPTVSRAEAKKRTVKVMVVIWGRSWERVWRLSVPVQAAGGRRLCGCYRDMGCAMVMWSGADESEVLNETSQMEWVGVGTAMTSRYELA